jgi:hypothetical protein
MYMSDTYSTGTLVTILLDDRMEHCRTIDKGTASTASLVIEMSKGAFPSCPLTKSI